MSLQHSLFLSTCCNPCLILPLADKAAKLSKCLGCNLILYCSAAHQKLDWPIHRKFCKAASAIIKTHKVDHLLGIDGPIESEDALNLTKLKVKYILRSILKRPLDYHEEELVSFPVMCAVCFSTKLSKLHQCKSCHAVSYCSEEHEREDCSRHRGECYQLRLHYCKFKIHSDISIKLVLQGNCNLFESSLSEAMGNMFGVEFPTDPSGSLAEYQNFSFVSDFSCVATVSYAMKHIKTEQCGEQFTLYVVGSTVDHVWFTDTHVQFLFACFPHLKRLNTIFIGPEIPDAINSEITLQLDEGRILFRQKYKGKLEDYLLDTENSLKPDMIACFNCGFSENTQKDSQEGDDWKKAISCMLELPDVPILFTSYTSMEADFDFGALTKVNEERMHIKPVHLERIIEKKLNPYRDMRPLRSWQFSDPEVIYYRNGYVQAMRIKTSVRSIKPKPQLNRN